MSRLRREVLGGVLIASFVILAGCARFEGVRVGWSGFSLPGHVSYSYSTFTGTLQDTFDVDEGQTINLDYEATVERGTLILLVEDPQGEPVWQVELTDDDSDSVEIMAPESGRYVARIEGQDTGGSFDLQWEVE
jgi:hypothetical protein